MHFVSPAAANEQRPPEVTSETERATSNKAELSKKRTQTEGCHESARIRLFHRLLISESSTLNLRSEQMATFSCVLPVERVAGALPLVKKHFSLSAHYPAVPPSVCPPA